MMCKEIYIQCRCGCKVMKVSEEPLYNAVTGKKSDYIVNACMYSLRKNKFPVSHKLRCIWNIIRYGIPYEDDIVIDREDSIKLKKFFEELENEYEEE